MIDILRIKPQNEEALYYFCKFILGYDIPRVPICKGHSTPFQFLAESFFYNVNSLVWSNRSGDKSFLAGLLTFLRSIFLEKAKTRIIGGSLEQSDKVYQYEKIFLESQNGFYRAYLKNEPTMRRTSYINGSDIEILTASQKSVRGQHVPFLILDEVDEMDRDLFYASLSIPQSMGGIKSCLTILSTQHYAYGTMSEILDGYKEKGLKLYKWCFWEIMERCNGECSGCLLLEECGEEKKGLKCQGHYPFFDILEKKRLLSNEYWQSEWCCMGIKREGLVYNEFSKENIAEVKFDPTLPVDVSIDPSKGLNPFAVGFIQEKEGQIRVIDEIYERNLLREDVCKLIIEKVRMNNWSIRNIIIDPAELDVKNFFRRQGFHCVDFDKGDIELGIELVKRKLKNQELIFDKSCINHIREFENYSRDNKGNVKKLNDHCCDLIRYYLIYWNKKIKKGQRTKLKGMIV